MYLCQCRVSVSSDVKQGRIMLPIVLALLIDERLHVGNIFDKVSGYA